MKMYRAMKPSIHALSTSLRVGSWRMAPSCVSTAAANTSSFQSIVSAPSLIAGLRKLQQVARVHLARVVRDGGRQVDRPDDRHAAVLDGLARARQLAVAAALGEQVDDHRARLHALDGGARDDARRRAARHAGGRDHAVGRGDARVQHFLLLGLLLGGQLARVAARAFGGHAGLDELRAERLAPVRASRCARRRPRPPRRGASRSRWPAGPRRPRR